MVVLLSSLFAGMNYFIQILFDLFGCLLFPEKVTLCSTGEELEIFLTQPFSAGIKGLCDHVLSWLPVVTCKHASTDTGQDHFFHFEHTTVSDKIDYKVSHVFS